MNKQIIHQIEKQIIELLPVGQRNQPGIFLADSCSEVSRLVAGWIKALDTSLRIIIVKGMNVCGTQKAHDVLAVITANNQVHIFDPTIWQFFPQAQSIFVCTVDTIDIALEKMKALYGGRWIKSEEFIRMNKDEEKKYLDIISKNIHENIG